MVIAWNSAMKRLLLGVAVILLLPIAMVHGADSGSVPRFNKVMIIILENANYRDALAQLFLGTLTKSGALLSQFYAEAHPSLPNYISLTSGTTGGVTSSGLWSLDLLYIGDLLDVLSIACYYFAVA